jgi:hypothetical protein
VPPAVARVPVQRRYPAPIASGSRILHEPVLGELAQAERAARLLGPEHAAAPGGGRRPARAEELQQVQAEGMSQGPDLKVAVTTEPFLMTGFMIDRGVSAPETRADSGACQ